ncbi:MAG: hypothetical protein A3F84_15005 [Candidatus Handelsmanbacteria bacterium RIFCSPLOWO2_12_FULL_64_10]|uniref:Phytanoyl-CoA dioxygenase n=1 Tax=Handelsmanbacteria sp. (strain RIFCSPLOWO2_12_FULL_64_10) TaxID=1817868 RepID=A0A1F6D1Z6_HANXR|nr:MAG: hypothetical protein A3F84_15005 [Candidatus Handelsmanbacteria bacterium RIFCSPLOWO2_12_FULL_64_10]
MARFVNDGFLRFDELAPDNLNRAACAEMEQGLLGVEPMGAPFRSLWPGRAIKKVFCLPEVEGIIHSLVGPDPQYDHHAVHIVDAGHLIGQTWHADAIIDVRTTHFDIQVFYFPHDTPREMGGTMLLPGSHYRRISETDIARYQNFVGQTPLICKAGTVVVVHHGIWHCAQPNRTDRRRYVFKLRLNPTVRQVRLWNTDDLDNPEIPVILNAKHKWYGNEGRIEVVNRIKFWRSLTGNDRFDVLHLLSRIENRPAKEAHAA